MRLVILSILLVHTFNLSGQNNSYTDSLELLLKQDSTGADAALILNELSWEYAEIETYRSLDLGFRALRLSLLTNDQEQYATSLSRIAIAYDILGEKNNSLRFFRKAFEERSKMGDRKGCANILNNIGAFYFYRNIPDSSLYYYKISADLRRAAGDSSGLAQSYNNIGLVYRSKRQYPEAEQAYRESLRIKEKLNDSKGIYYTITNITVLLLHTGNYQEAYAMAQRSLNYATSLNNQLEIAAAKINLGASGTHLLGKQLESKRLLEEGINYLEQAGERHNLAHGYYYLGTWHLSNKDSAKAENYYTLALNLSDELEKNELLEQLQLNLSQLYHKKGEYKKAAQLYNEYIQLHDSLFTIENQRLYNELYTSLENEKKEKIMSDLRYTNEVKDLNIRQNKTTQLILSIAIISAVIIILSLVALVRLRNKNTKILAEKNKLSLIRLEERELLIREIHHRVKNNLQLVSSILNLQSKYSKEQNPAELLEASKQRIRSISIIHEQLYVSNELKNVELKKYLGELSQEILRGSSGESVFLEMNIPEGSFDLDFAIPVGLILNELITNSCKYGRKKEETRITFNLLFNPEAVILEYSDNGKGFPEHILAGEQPSFGLKMIHSLSRKLRGEVSLKNNNGAIVSIFMKRTGEII